MQRVSRLRWASQAINKVSPFACLRSNKHVFLSLGSAGCAVFLSYHDSTLEMQGMAPTTASPLPYVGTPQQMGFRTSQSSEDVLSRRCQVNAKTFGKNAARVTCTNTTNSRLRVHIARGYMFQPESPDMQTLISEKDVSFMLEPGLTTARDIDAFCGYSKGRVPHGPMRATGLQAPPEVLGSQSQVWSWTRAWERSKPKPAGAVGWLKSLGSSRAAAQEGKILQQSYGINAKQHKDLQNKLEQIDKNPKQHQRHANTGKLATPGPAQPATQHKPAAASPSAAPSAKTSSAGKAVPSNGSMPSSSLSSCGRKK